MREEYDIQKLNPRKNPYIKKTKEENKHSNHSDKKNSK